MNRWPDLEQFFLQGRVRKVPVCRCLYTDRKLSVLDTYIGVLSYIYSTYNAYYPLHIEMVGTVLPHTGFQWFCDRGVLGSDLLLPLKQASWSASLFTVSVTVLLLGMVSSFCSREETGPWSSASEVYLAIRLMYAKCVVPPYL